MFQVYEVLLLQAVVVCTIGIGWLMSGRIMNGYLRGLYLTGYLFRLSLFDQGPVWSERERNSAVQD